MVGRCRPNFIVLLTAGNSAVVDLEDLLKLGAIQSAHFRALRKVHPAFDGRKDRVTVEEMEETVAKDKLWCEHRDAVFGSAEGFAQQTEEVQAHFVAKYEAENHVS